MTARLPRLGPLSGLRGASAAPRRHLLPITCFAYTASDAHRQGTYERILRYPDGNVRRIRYPAPVEEDLSSCTEASGDSWETLNVWKAATAKAAAARKKQAAERAAADADRGRAGKEAATAGVAHPFVDAQQQAAEEHLAPVVPQVNPDTVPDSPLQLLRYLTSEKYKATQAELTSRVRASYQVLEASPWLAPRTLYILATSQQPSSSGSTTEPTPGLTFTLRTRVGRPDQEAELTRVLGRRRPDGSPIIACSQVVDGVVAFEGEAAAGRFADALEAAGYGAEVSVASCNSHALFRSVQDARGVLVLVRPSSVDGWLPEPHQLATSLRGQRSFEELAES
ncbi:hypothetical protein N2152v2_001584 [Parachlorella kessleri]